MRASITACSAALCLLFLGGCAQVKDGDGMAGGAGMSSTGDGGGRATGASDLSTFLLDAQPLQAPKAQAPTETPCGKAEGCTVAPEPSATEFSCEYQLTTETRVAADALVALGPDPDLWPGNVLRAAAAAKGNLDAVPVALGKMRVASTLAGAKAVDVDEPSGSAFREALTKMLAGTTEPTGTAVGSNLHVESIFSEEDLSDTIGVDLSLVGASLIPASLGLESRTSTKKATTRVAVSFVQSYFQVSVDPHDDPADYFGPNVAAGDVDDALGDGDALVYVRSVTYGRHVVAVFESDEASNSEESEATISAIYSGVEGKASFEKDSTKTVNETRFAAMILGDSRVITSKDELFAYLDEPPDVTTAWPIGYALQYPGSEKPFSVGFTTEVVTKTCEECNESDPFADARSFDSALDVNPMMLLSDADSPGIALATGQLPPGQERWFKFDGRDDALSVVDPEAKIGSSSEAADVCIFADCKVGATVPVCLGDGVPAKQGTLNGCCSSGGDAWLTGDDSSGLCPANVSDDATIYVRVRLSGSALACVPFDLTLHY